MIKPDFELASVISEHDFFQLVKIHFTLCEGKFNVIITVLPLPITSVRMCASSKVAPVSSYRACKSDA